MLRLVRAGTAAGEAHQRPVEVVGELGSDRLAVPVLLGRGVSASIRTTCPAAVMRSPARDPVTQPAPSMSALARRVGQHRKHSPRGWPRSSLTRSRARSPCRCDGTPSPNSSPYGRRAGRGSNVWHHPAGARTPVPQRRLDGTVEGAHRTRCCPSRARRIDARLHRDRPPTVTERADLSTWRSPRGAGRGPGNDPAEYPCNGTVGARGNAQQVGRAGEGRQVAHRGCGHAGHLRPAVSQIGGMGAAVERIAR